jgi:predicted permease
VLGESVLLDGHPYTVIGVAPPGFDMPAGTEIWTPLAFNGPWMITGARFFEIIARLRPEATLDGAAADIADFKRWVDAEHAGRNIAEREYAVVALRDELVGSVRTTLWTLLGAVGIVLLVIAANLTNFLLTQAKAREREFSLRAALGGSRGRLVRQALIETALLVAVGGALGLLVALGSTQLLASRAASLLPRAAEISPDLRVFGFALGLSLLTGALVGLLPALGASRPDLNAVLKGGGTARGARWGARDALVVAQVALALVLLVGAGLLVRSYLGVRAVELGFDPDHALSFAVAPPSTSYASEQRTRFFDELAERIARLEGVDAVGVSNFLPLADSTAVGLFLSHGESASDENGRRSPATIFVVGGDYFEAMGMPLLRGRAFTPIDTAESPPVIIVNEALVEVLSVEGNPVGERVWIGNNDAPHEIVGVVAATHHLGIEDEVEPQVYAPHTQETWRLKYVVVRTRVDPLSLAGAVREQVRALDPNLPIYDLATMEDRLAQVLGRRRLTTSLIGAFGIVALLLSGLGTYGMASNWVVQRTREVGIRIALGARVADVQRQFLRRGLILAITGMILGLAGGLALTRFVASLLFGVEPLDPPTLIAVCLVLLAVALLAIALPARRAARLDPVEALRAD